MSREFEVTKAWVIKHPRYELDVGAIGESEQEAWGRFLDGSIFTRLDAEQGGYRCIRVTITEEPK